MKTRIFFFCILLFSPYTLFPQDEIGLPKLKPTNDYWDIGFYGSANIGIANSFATENSVQPGYGGIFELTYNDSKRDLLMIAGYHKLNSKPENEHFEVVEFSIGPRFSINKNKTQFIEFTAGGLMISEIKLYYNYWDYNYSYYQKSYPSFNFGASVAVGGKIQLSQNNDLVFKLRLMNSLSSDKELFSYFSVNTGFVFTTKGKMKLKALSRQSYFSAALLCGGNKSDNYDVGIHGLGFSYGAELTYKSSPKVEIEVATLSGNLKSEHDNYYTRYSYVSVTGGGRFYLNESRATAFIELGGGFYAFRTKNDYYEDTEDYPGIYAGTGTKIGINQLIDLIAKVNLHFVLTERYALAPNYLTFHGGVRVNL